MSDPLDDFEIEEPIEDPAAADLGDDLWPEDRENLEKAMNDCHEIFRNPPQADPEKAFEALEIFEGVQPSISDVQVSDQMGEVIELLHDVCDEIVLSPEDGKEGKRIILELAEALEIHLSFLDGKGAAS